MSSATEGLRIGPLGLVLIWPNITIVVNVVFQKILALTILHHMGSSKRITVQKNVLN